MTRLYLALGALTGVLLSLWAFYLWAHGKGEAECQARHQAAALAVTTKALDQAGTQNKVDAALAVDTTKAVETVRTEYRDRIVYIDAQPLTPPSVAAGDADALACPDYLADPWVRLFDGPGGGEPEAPAPRPTP